MKRESRPSGLHANKLYVPAAKCLRHLLGKNEVELLLILGMHAQKAANEPIQTEVLRISGLRHSENTAFHARACMPVWLLKASC